LGMADTCWGVPEALKPRLVQRADDEPGAEALTRGGIGEVPWAAGGAHATALDMAIFGQMFLNRGTYGEVQVLSPATVSAMTRNQLPGISSTFLGGYFPEASWGLGWDIHGPKRSLADGEILSSADTYCHGGLGGVFLWVDPVYELIGVHFSVLSRGGISATVKVSEDKASWLARRADLFVNAATAAIVE